jgi:hypothetical protein
MEEKKDLLRDLTVGHNQIIREIKDMCCAYQETNKSPELSELFDKNIQSFVDCYMLQLYPQVCKKYLNSFTDFFKEITDIISSVSSLPLSLAILPINRLFFDYLENFIRTNNITKLIEIGKNNYWACLLTAMGYSTEFYNTDSILLKNTDSKAVLILIGVQDCLQHFEGDHLIFVDDGKYNEVFNIRLKRWELIKSFDRIKHYQRRGEIPFELLPKRAQRKIRQQKREDKNRKKIQRKNKKS